MADLEEFAKAVEQELASLAPDEHLPYLKGRLASIENPAQRAIAEKLILLGRTIGQQVREQVVVLVHGIRTHAIWQDRIASALRKEGLYVYPIGYGYLDVFRFWCPIGFRAGPVERVLRELRGIQVKHRNAALYVIAHSFGTFILSRVLSEHPDVKIDRLLLCGSVIPESFRWDLIPAHPAEGVINDVGARDLWPILAKLASWGYGCSGTFGFRTQRVIDRFHNLGHSDFFTDDHTRRYWIPYITKGTIVDSDWRRENPPGWMSILSIFPMKTVSALLLIGTILVMILGNPWAQTP